jgi:AcrR family transcriptional regulator
MRIRDLERESRVPRSRIHYYIREGLLHPPAKTGKTSALYDQSHLERLEAIQRIKMEYLADNKRFRMSSELLKLRLDELESSAQEGGVEDAYTMPAGPKKEIIEAALRLYPDRGYYHTNLEDIAREADLSASDVYMYFSDKRELFVGAIEYALQIINRDIREAIADEENPLNITLSMFQVFRTSYPKLGDMINQLRAGVAIDDRWAQELLLRLYRDISQEVSKTLQELMKRGLAREADADLQAFIFTFVAEAVFQRASFDDKYSFEEIGTMVADWIYRGIAPQSNGD